METFGVVALVLVATAWSAVFVMWVLGLPRSRAEGPAQLAARGSDRD